MPEVWERVLGDRMKFEEVRQSPKMVFKGFNCTPPSYDITLMAHGWVHVEVRLPSSEFVVTVERVELSERSER